MPRAYRLGRRQAAVDRTAASILRAARELVAGGGSLSVGAVAHQAGVSRVTVYNRFGARGALLEALAPPPVGAGVEPATGDPREALHGLLVRSCAVWADDPALYRNLGARESPGAETLRLIAERLAAADALRPGCSLKEAEDVISVLTSFPVFDRLHRDGRRSPVAVAEVLARLARGILA